MLDLSFLDEINTPAEEVVTSDNPPAIGSPDQKAEELMQLKDLAEFVGSFKWQYDNDNEIHDGIVTQDLLKVPGLKDAVKIDEATGLQTVDTKFLSLAAIGYIAALARIVLGDK